MYLQMFDIAMMLNFFKIKSQLKLSLLSLFFLFGCNGTIFIYLYSSIFVFQKRFYCYFFDQKIFASLNISMNKLSLNFLFMSQSSFTYVLSF